MSIKKQIYVFGAGNIGRGLLAELLLENGYSLNYFDADPQLIQVLKNHSYKVSYLNSDQILEYRMDQIWNVHNSDFIAKQFKNADYLLTAIGAHNFTKIVPIIKNAIEQRITNQPLVLIAFENHFAASEALTNLVKADLNPKYHKLVQFINVVVDRIIPNQVSDLLMVENFVNIFYEKNNYKFPFSNLDQNNKKIQAVDNFAEYFQLKFLGVNGLHTLLAFLSQEQGYQYVNELVKINNYQEIIHAIITEMSMAIAAITKLKLNFVHNYLITNFQRFINPELLDENNRILRNLKQKIMPNERLYPIWEYFFQKGINHNYFMNLFNRIKIFLN
ncbi:mannitol-1-phosphate 5-dehydrogenase [Mycoplasmoides fastidiosum]|uniref:Mannitol-1-phosphate 5-dehydrogenase n=1 Tax=Mycoplasmoides fastidiosum TaxID=92758 RepID=A0ABU0LZX0_9BACT|nr:hypothetical protein [Mycoplasmoides fastidiosum]MDQ0514253.1 mannitol-1-phosphate 5-dehydrogenase [Mycoplasmoides fastidiosum]UUD37339.1 hypothetical protein NPA10_02020 [Mycoplasmoides fastidiosum]